MSFTKVKITNRDAIIIAIFTLFLVEIARNQLINLPVQIISVHSNNSGPISINVTSSIFPPFEYLKESSFITNVTNSSDFQVEQLLCEKVWNNVIKTREKELTSRVKPSHNFVEEFLEIISENKTICQGISTTLNTNVKLLVIVVNSKMNHFEERQIIRESYGSITEYKSKNVKWHVRLAFLVAQSDYCLSSGGNTNLTNWKATQRQENQLAEEQQKYGDLVMGSFTDTYRNNTYKQLMGYKFVLERCSQADLIVKTDDDVFVNIPAIITKRMEENKGNKTVHDIYCPVLRKFKPDRLRKLRYFVTENEWSTDLYPDFCAGAFMVISFDWMRMLYSVRKIGGFFWIDDTHISGRLREIAEKEFGIKANFLDIDEDIWWKGLEKPKICVKATPQNIQLKKNGLPMFAQLLRDNTMETNMKCLTNISLGITNEK